jgi:hypothetical protein
MNIGSLSAKYEANGNPATVSGGDGDAGGRSYGSYQFSGRQGVFQEFVQWLKNYAAPYDEYGRQLEAAGDPAGEEFAAKWREIGTIDPGGFGRLQEEYVKPVYFDAGVKRLQAWYGFDILKRSQALQGVLWSNCVQHGNYYGAQVFGEAAKRAGWALNDMDDAAIITQIYEVKLTDFSWSSGAPGLRPGLFARWRNERTDALRWLATGSF